MMRPVFAKCLIYLLLAAGAVFFLVPFVWMVITSLKGPEQAYQLTLGLRPAELRWENYRDAWAALPFTRFLFNTLFITVTATIGQVFSATLVAYGFARFRFPGRRVLFVILLSTMMIPSVVTLVPTFLLWRWVGLIDTFDPLMLGSWFGGNAFFIFLARQFFMGIPVELEEAARLEGASAVRVYWHIMLPLAKPLMLAMVLIAFVAQWNDFLGPLVFLNDFDRYTMTLGLRFFEGSFMGEAPKWHWMMAMTTLMAVPVLLIFFVAQRHFVEGVSLTGMKG